MSDWHHFSIRFTSCLYHFSKNAFIDCERLIDAGSIFKCTQHYQSWSLVTRAQILGSPNYLQYRQCMPVKALMPGIHLLVSQKETLITARFIMRTVNAALSQTCVLDVGGNPSVRAKESAKRVHYSLTELDFIACLQVFYRFWTTSVQHKYFFSINTYTCMIKMNQNKSRNTCIFLLPPSTWQSRNSCTDLREYVWVSGSKVVSVTPLVVANPPWILQCKPYCAPDYTCPPLCLCEGRTEEV